MQPSDLSNQSPQPIEYGPSILERLLRKQEDEYARTGLSQQIAATRIPASQFRPVGSVDDAKTHP